MFNFLIFFTDKRGKRSAQEKTSVAPSLARIQNGITTAQNPVNDHLIDLRLILTADFVLRLWFLLLRDNAISSTGFDQNLPSNSHKSHLDLVAHFFRTNNFLVPSLDLKNKAAIIGRFRKMELGFREGLLMVTWWATLG